MSLCADLPHPHCSMVLSGGRREQGGGNGGGRHFRHHHSSLLSSVLVPPVIFLGLLAAVAWYVWLTSFYLVASLFVRDSKLASGGGARRRVGDDRRVRNGKGKAVKPAAELLAGDSAAAERLEVKASRDVSATTKSAAAADDDDELVKEVIILEEITEQIDASEEEHNIREVTTSDHVFPTVLSMNSSESNQIMVLPSISSFHHYVRDISEEFLDDWNEMSACSSSEICSFIDKHETREHVLDSNAAKDADWLLEFLAAGRDDSDEHVEIQKVFIHDSISELLHAGIMEAKKKKKIIVASHEVHHLTETELNEDSEDIIRAAPCSDDLSDHHTEAHQDHKLGDLTANAIDGASSAASEVSEFADERDEVNESCSSQGVPCRLAVARGPPAPWWNLCGVLDAFGGCED